MNNEDAAWCKNESDLLDTDLLPIRAAEGIPFALCEAAPTGCPVVICFASCIGSSNLLELSTNRKSAPFPAQTGWQSTYWLVLATPVGLGTYVLCVASTIRRQLICTA